MKRHLRVGDILHVNPDDLDEVGQLIHGADWPHTRGEGAWRDLRPKVGGIGEEFFSYERVVFYLSRLLKSGYTEVDALNMLVDLYWDAVTEKHLDDLDRLNAKAKKFLGEVQNLRHPGLSDARTDQPARSLPDPAALPDEPVCTKCGETETSAGPRCEHC